MLYPHAVVQRGAVFSSAAALSPGQMVYESMAEDRFVLRDGSQTLQFEGHTFHPAVPLAGKPIYFELLTGGRSHIVAYRDSAETIELDATEPAISPDGTKLAYVSQGSLVVVQTGLRSGRHVSGPAFFPDGQHIAYAEGAPGSREIHSTALTGTDQQALTKAGDCFQPAVAPNGSAIAFACSGGGGTQISLLHLKTGNRRQITHGACNNTYPAWAPDASSVVFSSDCNRGVELPALLRAPAF